VAKRTCEPVPGVSSEGLRREISARNLHRGERFAHELTFGGMPNVIYRESEGVHGNFLAASYKRICANPAWAQRLEKTYTASARVPRRWDRKRGELECASSSDALLMNVFCYPRFLCRPEVCALLGVERGLQPEFGVRAGIAMRRDEVDRTELDMRLGPLMVEAKLTESGFGVAARSRLLRYVAVEDVFDIDELPWRDDRVCGYQLIRGVLAAQAGDARFVVLCDRRRADLLEMWFRVLRAVKRADVRSRMALLHWQELAAVSPAVVREFLAVKYGVE
jgi:hypothetical protein